MTVHSTAKVRIASRVLSLAGIIVLLSAFLGADNARRVFSAVTWKVRGGSSIPSRNLIYQKTWADCGPAALATLLLALHRSPLSRDEIDSLAVLYPAGTTVGDLENVARRRGLLLDIFAPVGEEWIGTRPPYIALLANHHFVVVEGVSNGVARIGDPAGGGIAIAINRFSTVRPRVIMRPRP